jgi:hypothetical protein
LHRDVMGELSLKNRCWQIAALLGTERTHCNDPVIRQRLHRRRNVLVTPFADDDKRNTVRKSGCGTWIQYRRIYGEDLNNE